MMSLLYCLVVFHVLFCTSTHGYDGHYGLPPRILPEAMQQQQQEQQQQHYSNTPPVYWTATSARLSTADDAPALRSMSSASVDVQNDTRSQTRRIEDLTPTTTTTTTTPATPTPTPTTTATTTAVSTTTTTRGLLQNVISGFGGSSSGGYGSRGYSSGGYGSRGYSSGGYGSGSSGSSSSSATGSMFPFTFERMSTPKPKPVKPGNFDKQFDGLIVNLAKALRTNGFDPIRIGNLQQCTNCSMEGLSLIRRSGPANLVYVNRTIIVDAHITLPAIYISCFPCIDVILMVPLTGMLEIAIWGLEIYGKVSQKISRGESPSLITYDVLNEGDLDIRFNGLGMLGPLTEFGFKVIRQRQVSDIIREFVYERVPKFIRRRLKGFSFPIGK